MLIVPTRREGQPTPFEGVGIIWISFPLFSSVGWLFRQPNTDRRGNWETRASVFSSQRVTQPSVGFVQLGTNRVAIVPNKRVQTH